MTSRDTPPSDGAGANVPGDPGASTPQGGRPLDPRNADRLAGTSAATIAHVAEKAGVSTATVSRYLRGHRVRRAEHIAAVIEQLSYRPSAAARGLRMRMTQAVGVIVHDITNPYAAAVVRGIQSVANPQSYSLYLASGHDNIRQAIDDVAGRVDGIICAAATEHSEAIQTLAETRKPTVLLEFEPHEQPHLFDAIVITNEAGAREATEYLIGLGHRRIASIAGPQTTSPGQERLVGFEKAMRAANLPVSPDLVEFSDFAFQGGYQATARLMGRGHAPTAIFAHNNLTALGSLQCLHDIGVKIPDEVSFVGFDPLDACELFDPPPTTVERPRSEQGVLAMRLLRSRMEGGSSPSPRRIVLETTLAVRHSCAPPI